MNAKPGILEGLVLGLLGMSLGGISKALFATHHLVLAVAIAGPLTCGYCFLLARFVNRRLDR